MNSLFWVMGLSGGRLVLDIDELADALGLAKQTVYNQLSDGTLPIPTRKQRKRIFADARDVAEYLDSERDKAREVHRAIQSRIAASESLSGFAKSH